MQVEYKISTIIETESEKWVHGKVNSIQFSEIDVTEENKAEYPLNEIGDKIQNIIREKLTEFKQCFTLTETDEEINNKLNYIAAYYGEVIN